MARRSVTEDVEYPVLDPDPVSEEKPARRAARGKKEEQAKKRRTFNLFYLLLPAGAVAAAFLIALAFHQVELFLIRDARFHLAPPAGYGQDSPSLVFSGVVRSSKAEMMRIFEPDFNRSLYLFSAEERRRNLLAVDWVKGVTVSRRWPNHVYVDIVEREPVAFVQIERRGQRPQFKLIDPEGVLLPVPRTDEKFDFGIIRGISETEPEASRRMRVQQVLGLFRDAKSAGVAISEVDVSDPGNLTAMIQIEENAVTLRMGSRNYNSRLENLKKNFREIHKIRPSARSFDLRIDGRITALEEEAADVEQQQ